MTIPRSVCSAVGLADGDMVEVKANGNQIIITPQIVIDGSGFLNADFLKRCFDVHCLTASLGVVSQRRTDRVEGLILRDTLGWVESVTGSYNRFQTAQWGAKTRIRQGHELSSYTHNRVWIRIRPRKSDFK